MAAARITLCLDEPIGTINPNLYGHFCEHLGSCINSGIWVGEDSSIPNIGGLRTAAVEALQKIHIPVLRWPGGCFADDYHWMDGVGPRSKRPRTVNLHWGCDIEKNQFGTHEFHRLCSLVGAEPYIAGNLGSGSVRELRDWVEYCNFPGDSSLARLRGENGSPLPMRIKFWGVGNEAWGCGGHLDPEEYAAEYKRYSTFMGDFGDTPLYLIACGPDGNNLDWTRRFFTKMGDTGRIHGFAAHYYCGTAGTAMHYSTDQWYELLYRAAMMEQLVLQQRALMDEFPIGRKVGLIIDEWGTWHPPTPGRHPLHLWQQNTLRDALVAAITLDVFNRHADNIVMANLAQVANVLQALFLCEEEKFLLTPTYHVFDMYQSHQGGQSVRVEIESPEISFANQDKLFVLTGSASLNKNGFTLSIVNSHATLPAVASIELRGRSLHQAHVTTLSDSDITAHNTFEKTDRLVPNISSIRIENEWNYIFPPASITVFTAQ